MMRYKRLLKLNPDPERIRREFWEAKDVATVSALCMGGATPSSPVGALVQPAAAASYNFV